MYCSTLVLQNFAIVLKKLCCELYYLSASTNVKSIKKIIFKQQNKNFWKLLCWLEKEIEVTKNISQNILKHTKQHNCEN